MLKRVTVVCIEAMPAFWTRSSHVPGSVARADFGNVKRSMRKHITKREMVSIED